MLIRPAIADDIPGVLPMVAKICALHQAWDEAKFGFLPNPERRYDRWLLQQIRKPQSVFLVADSSSSDDPSAGLAGFLIATTEQEIPIYRLQRYGFIHDLWIEEGYRRTGLARQMVQAAIARFQHIGVDQVRLEVAVANEAAQHLFQTCGFRASTIEMLVELDSL